MLTYQPFFMLGIDDVKLARGNAYKACFFFVFTFVASIVYLIKDALTIREERDRVRRRRSGNDYDGIPQHTGQSALEDYANDLNLPQTVESGIFS